MVSNLISKIPLLRRRPASVREIPAGPAGPALKAAVAIVIALLSLAYFAADLTGREPDTMESQDLEIAANMFTTPTLPPDQSPVFYLLLNAWMQINHLSLAFIRVLPSAFAALAAAVLYLFASRELGEKGGVLAAVFFAGNAMVVDAARTARGYSLILLLGTLCLLYAHRFLTGGRRRKDLGWFLFWSVIGIYTHFFFLLFVGSIGLVLLADRAFDPDERGFPPFFWRDIAFSVIAAAPQLARVTYVMGYAKARKSLYVGMSQGTESFFRSLGVDLFLSPAKHAVIPAWTLVVIVAGILLGAAALKRRGVLAGALLVFPSLGAAWYLNRSSPMHTRYVIYLIPVFFFFLAAGLSDRRLRLLWIPAAIGVVAVNLASVRADAPDPPSDWDTVADYIDSVRGAGDVVAVFPDYWRLTFQTYYDDPEMAAFTFVEDLDRILAGGRRTILVVGLGRPFNNAEDFLKGRAKVVDTFKTKVRRKIKVYVVEPKAAPPPEFAAVDSPSILIGGIVGSGGYPWQRADGYANPFDGIARTLESADLTVTGYTPYDPPLLARLFLGSRNSRDLTHPEDVLTGLSQSGVDAIAAVPTLGQGIASLRLPESHGIESIADQALWSAAEPRVFDVKGTRVGILHCGQNIFTDKPVYREKGDATVAEWEEAVRRGKDRVGPRGRLVIFLPQPPNYSRLFRPQDQYLARRAIDLGADVVVGMGGWTVKEIEHYKNGLIAYSLGTLLRPPVLERCSLDSTGILLKIGFHPDGTLTDQVIPVTFDSAFHPVPGRRMATRNLSIDDTDNAHREHLLPRLVYADVGFEDSSGRVREAARYVTNESLPEPRPIAWFTSLRASLRQWLYSGNAAPTVQDRYEAGRAFVGLDGVEARGLFRRALVIEPGSNKSAWIKFPSVAPGEYIRLSFGVSDKAIRNKSKRFPPEQLSLRIGDRTIWKRRIEYLSGWHTNTIRAEEFGGQPQDLTIVLDSPAKNGFPVAVDPVVIRSEPQIESAAAGPYAFADHIREARAFVRTKDGVDRPCTGPDETPRYLRGRKDKYEERGDHGEGILHARWVCGELPWDAAALTIQKSGGDLRPAIWLHPVEHAERHLAYGPMQTGGVIRGYMGMTDLSMTKNHKPVTFSIFVGPKRVLRKTLSKQTGWQDFSVPIPEELRNQSLEISFVTEAKHQTWRHFCFNAWME